MTEPDFTISEIKAELERIKALVGSKAYVDVTVSVGSFRANGVNAVIYPGGIGGSGGRLSSDGEDFRTALAKIEALWLEQQDAHAADTIRRMALEIISTTMDLGSCSDAALRGSGFAQTDIKRYGARACEVANEMAGKGPFEIVQHDARRNEPEAA